MLWPDLKVFPVRTFCLFKKSNIPPSMKCPIGNNTVAYILVRDFMNFLLMPAAVAMDKVRFR